MGAIGIIFGGLVGHVATTFSSRDSIHEAVEREVYSNRQLEREKAAEITRRATSLMWSSILCYRLIPWVVGFDVFFIIMILTIAGHNPPAISYVYVVICTVAIPLLVKGTGYYMKKADDYLRQNINVSVDDIANRIEKEAKAIVRAEERAQKEREREVEQAKKEKARRSLKHQCSDCGTLTRYGANYCSGCGKKIDWEKLLNKKLIKNTKQEYCCNECGAKLKNGMRYCPGCGKELEWSNDEE